MAHMLQRPITNLATQRQFNRIELRQALTEQQVSLTLQPFQIADQFNLRGRTLCRTRIQIRNIDPVRAIPHAGHVLVQPTHQQGAPTQQSAK